MANHIQAAKDGKGVHSLSIAGWMGETFWLAMGEPENAGYLLK
jgi:hypothetical protein